ncbi:MAG: helix-turn-helix domain-containing protein [Alphaproteobacteria bacterium]|nr:helix-turn-helix domain-containing protein [Alphaproteobacteria bacterium]
METLDDIVRYNAVGMLLWLSVLMFRDFCDRRACWLGSFSAISSAAYLLMSKPGLAIFGIDVDHILFPLAFLSPVASWLFCLSLFDDHFKIKSWHLGVGAAKLLTGGIAYYEWLQLRDVHPHPQITLAGAITILIVLGILAHLIFVAWRGRNDDLVEVRRQFRTVFVSAVIVISIGILIAEGFLIGYGFEPYLLLLQSFSFLAIALYLNWRMTKQGAVDLFFGGENNLVPGKVVAPNGRDSDMDHHDLQVLKTLEVNGFVMEPGLSIARMAETANMPEHRLRRLINQHLGYRNFADYLNHHRILAAKESLSDTEKRHVPVLTIAMDLGYGSLGPFNRAFKERTGQTPTEYRRAALG